MAMPTGFGCSATSYSSPSASCTSCLTGSGSSRGSRRQSSGPAPLPPGILRFSPAALPPGRASAMNVVCESLVTAMLAPLKLEFDPKVFDLPFGPKDLADFKASGITGFHHSVGIGDPGAKTQALDFLAS